MKCRFQTIVLAVALCLSIVPAASGRVARSLCDGDLDDDGAVTIDEIITSVNNALNGCPAPTFTPVPVVTPTETPTAAVPGSCQSSMLGLPPGTTASCVGRSTDSLDGCAAVRLEGTCSPGRVCAPATATCSCVGGPLGGTEGACNFSKIPGGIGCHGICTGSCVISLEAQ